MRNDSIHQQTSIRRRPVSFILLAVLGAALATLLLAGCSAGGSTAENSAQTSAVNEPTSSAATTDETSTSTPDAPDTTTPQDDTNAEQGSRNRGDADRGARVALRIEGDPGISFTGTCRAGGREETIEGDTPQRYTYRLREGQRVNCEVRRTDGDGTLVLNMRSGGTIFNQESNGDAVLRASLNASEDGSSGSSSTSSTSVNSSSSIQQSSGSSSSTSSSSINVIQGNQSDE